jgi:hypothetical protein
MTALASLVGFWPLVSASGAGAASRWSLGTAVFGGLLIATIINYLLTPVLYVVIKNLADWLFSNGKRPPGGTRSTADERLLDRSEPLAGTASEPQSARRIEGDTPA